MTNYGVFASRFYHPAQNNPFRSDCPENRRSRFCKILLAGLVTSLVSILLHRSWGARDVDVTKFATMTSSEDRTKNTVITTTATDAATALESLRLVSFNVAGCVPSKEAPSNWDTTTAAAAMVQEVLKSDPDIIALQECPGSSSSSGEKNTASKLAQTFFPAYQVIGSTPSHADNVVLLIKNGISAKHVPMTGGSALWDTTTYIPGVLAELTWKDRRHLLVASVHLAPFRDGASQREQQVEALLKYAKKKDGGEGDIIPLLFAGDTNMRVSEDTIMEDDLGLLDIWKLGGAQPETKFTWDTMDHTNTTTSPTTPSSAGAGGSFNRYYGLSTRQYNARYDRIYLFNNNNNNNNKTLSSVAVDSFQLIANQPLTNPYHFLSDHFGIMTELSFNWVKQSDE